MKSIVLEEMEYKKFNNMNFSRTLIGRISDKRTHPTNHN